MSWLVVPDPSAPGRKYDVVDAPRVVRVAALEQKLWSGLFLFLTCLAVIALAGVWIVFGEPTKTWAAIFAGLALIVIVVLHDVQRRSIWVDASALMERKFLAQPACGLWLSRRIVLTDAEDRSVQAVLSSADRIPLLSPWAWTISHGEARASRVDCVPRFLGLSHKVLVVLGFANPNFQFVDESGTCVGELTLSRSSVPRCLFVEIKVSPEVIETVGIAACLLAVRRLRELVQ